MVDFAEIEKTALNDVEKYSKIYEEAALFNTEKVMKAFRNHMVSDYYLKPTTGYAYSDVGRENLDAIYAEIFHTEAALVRSQFVSGTHALAVALLGVLRAGDEMIAATGTPYDTMQTIIGSPVKTPGSLVDLGVIYKEIPMQDDKPDLEAICSAITDKTRLIHIQRSCGYSSVRKTLNVAQIGEICAAVKKVKPDVICFVDNCYGEFVERTEPTQVGADLVVGSLIKNPGGGLAPTGGYLAGRKNLIEGAAMRLTTPGIGKECGSTLGNNRLLYQGLFLAPHTVAQAVKTAVFAARIMEELGYRTEPASGQIRHDIIQMIHFGEPEPLKRFCRGIQKGAPVDSYVTPEPWDMPGYDCQVIMAAGAFIQGASIELSCDAPMREPYTAYFQGGLTYESGKTGILLAVEELLNGV